MADIIIYINPPFCERHQCGYETTYYLSFFIFPCYISFVKLTNYRTRGGEWRKITLYPAYIYVVGCPYRHQ